MLKNSRLARERLTNPSKRERPKRSKKIFILMFSGLLLLILLLAIIIPRSRRSDGEDHFATLNTRLGHLEERLTEMATLEKKLNRIEEQNTKFAISIMDRVDRLEKSMIFKMGNMEKTPTPETASSPPASRRVVQKQEKPTFHVVKPGENLYRIGLKYGLSTNEVRQLNNLTPNSIIHVGQKLSVGKGGQN